MERSRGRPPLVLLHGFLESACNWELVLRAIERRHDVLAPALPGHLCGPAIEDEAGDDALLDGVERIMDQASFDTAHVAGNSLGGWLALKLAARGRGCSVVAFAPAGGRAAGDEPPRRLLEFQRRLHDQTKAAAPHADALVATPDGRRRATEYLTTNYEHVPTRAARRPSGCGGERPAAHALIERALEGDWTLDAERIERPVRIVWGTADRLRPCLRPPPASARTGCRTQGGSR